MLWLPCGNSNRPCLKRKRLTKRIATRCAFCAKLLFRTMYISPKFQSIDWQKLDFSQQAHWRKAVVMLDDRLNGRFFRPVRSIEAQDYSGFAVLALDCLVMETLQQLKEGVEETPWGKGGEYFKRFLTQTSFKVHFDAETAAKFYDQFRCGILHQAEIKKDSKVWRVGKLVDATTDGKGLIINRRLFHSELRRVFAHYLRTLRAGKDLPLRENFRKKMNHICR